MVVAVEPDEHAGTPGAIFWRAISNGNVIVAESVAREFEKLPLDYALRSRNLSPVDSTSETLGKTRPVHTRVHT